MDRLSVIKLSIVNNRLSNQSRDSEPSRLSGDVVFLFSGCMAVPRFIGMVERQAFGQYFREHPVRFTEIKFVTLSETYM